jgi:hypothetical protein
VPLDVELPEPYVLDGDETACAPLQLEEGWNGFCGCGKSLQKLPWAASM